MTAPELSYRDGKLVQTIRFNEMPTGEPRSHEFVLAEMPRELGMLLAAAPDLLALVREALATLERFEHDYTASTPPGPRAECVGRAKQIRALLATL